MIGPLPEVSTWSEWYSKYLDRKVFYSRGFMFNGHDVRSVEFKKYFVKGQFEYVGKVNRHVGLKSREVDNGSFREFCASIGVPYPEAYRQISPTLDASFRSVSKYDKPQPTLYEKAWLVAGDWTKQHFKVMYNSTMTPLPEVLREMDKTTSCGYPWNLKFKNKTDFLADPRAPGALDDYWDIIARGDNTTVPIWTCTQKRELRELEKVKEQKHRTFLASPFEHSSSLNRFCLHQNNVFYDYAGDGLWSTVGMSKFMGGTDATYRRLSRHPNAFELDESEYDSSLFCRALYGQRDIRWDMLKDEFQTPENKERFAALYDSIVHSVIVLENGELGQKDRKSVV